MTDKRVILQTLYFQQVIPISDEQLINNMEMKILRIADNWYNVKQTKSDLSVYIH